MRASPGQHESEEAGAAPEEPQPSLGEATSAEPAESARSGEDLPRQIFPFPNKKFTFGLTHILLFAILISLLAMTHHPAQDGSTTETEKSLKKAVKKEKEKADGVPLGVLRKRLPVEASGLYWGQSGGIAALIHAVHVRGREDVELEVMVQGTNLESILKWATGSKDKLMRIHMCGGKCPSPLDAEKLLHGEYISARKGEDLPWMMNLVAEPTGGKEAEAAEPPTVKEKGEEKKGKKKKEKGRGRSKEKDRSRKRKHKRSSRGSSSGEKEKKKKLSLRGEAKKSLKVIYGGTGIDPDPRFRRKYAAKAAKKAKKKGHSSSSSRTSETKSESSSEKSVELFGEDQKIRRLGKIAPGALTCAAFRDIQSSLLTASGGVWDPEDGVIPPVACQYYRQNMQHRLQGGQAREALTVACAFSALPPWGRRPVASRNAEAQIVGRWCRGSSGSQRGKSRFLRRGTRMQRHTSAALDGSETFPVLALNGDAVECLVSLDKQLRYMVIQRTGKKDHKRRALALETVDQVCVGKEALDESGLPLTEFCVCLLLTKGQAVALIFPNFQSMDNYELMITGRVLQEILVQAGLSEAHHRLRTFKNSVSSDVQGVTNTEARRTAPRVSERAGKLVQKGIKPEAIREAVKDQKIELVLTAHPTEAQRRSALKKHEQMLHQMKVHDGKDQLTPGQLAQLYEKIKAIQWSCWRTNTVRRTRPTPEGEARNGMLVIEETSF
eukprot:g3201.t1